MIGNMGGLAQAAYDHLCGIHDTLRAIKQNQEDDAEGQRTYARSDGFVIPDALAGAREAKLFLPPGIAWELKSFSVTVTAASALTAGYLAFYIDQEAGPNLIKVVDLTDTTLMDEAFLDGHYVPEQSSLLVVCRSLAGPAAVAVSGRITSRGYQNGTPRPTQHNG